MLTSTGALPTPRQVVSAWGVLVALTALGAGLSIAAVVGFFAGIPAGLLLVVGALGFRVEVTETHLIARSNRTARPRRIPLPEVCGFEIATVVPTREGAIQSVVAVTVGGQRIPIADQADQPAELIAWLAHQVDARRR